MYQDIVTKDLNGVSGMCKIEPKVRRDQRDYFIEVYNQRCLEENGLEMIFVQDNQSL